MLNVIIAICLIVIAVSDALVAIYYIKNTSWQKTCDHLSDYNAVLLKKNDTLQDQLYEVTVKYNELVDKMV